MKIKGLKHRLSSMPQRITRTSSWRDPGMTAAQRGYGYRWQCERAEYLLEHPLCVHCKSLRIVTVATIVDHIKPHRGDMVLFWDRNNWQSLCTTCHNVWKAALERNG